MVRFWILTGPEENWSVAFKENKWGVRKSLKQRWEKISTGDILAFYVKSPISGIIGLGKVTKTSIEKTPYWPDEKKNKAVIYPFRFYFKPIYSLPSSEWKKQKLQIKKLALSFYAGINSLTKKEKIESLLKNCSRAWDQDFSEFTQKIEVIKEEEQKEEKYLEKPRKRKKFFELPRIKKEERVESFSTVEIERLKKRGFLIKRQYKNGKNVLMREKKKWDLFEELIFLFFRDCLGFENVEGGKENKFGRFQVDVSAGYKNWFFIVECTTSEKNPEKSLLSKLKDFIAEQKEIKKATEKRYGRVYQNFKFIFATKGILCSEKDLQFAKENDVFIWTERAIDSYLELYKLIGPTVIYTLLTDLQIKKIKKLEKKKLMIKAVRVSFDKETSLFSFFLDAETLLKLSYVLRIQPGKEGSYQRFLNKQKLKSIAEFIDNGEYFKNNIILGVSREPTFVTKEKHGETEFEKIEYGILYLPSRYCSLKVIDGQHRLYGFSLLPEEKRKMLLPVTLLVTDDVGKQAWTFLEINRTQKPVPPDILWNLLGELDPDSLHGIITRFVISLSKDYKQLRNKIYIPNISRLSSKKYGLKLNNIAKGFYDRRLLNPESRWNLFGKQLTLSEIDDEQLTIAFKNFTTIFDVILEAIKKSNIPQWKEEFLLQNNGFNVFLHLMRAVLQFYFSVEEKALIKKQLIEGTIEKPLIEFFKLYKDQIDTLRRQTSSEGERKAVATQIILSIHSEFKDFGRSYLKEVKDQIRKSEPYKNLKTLELSLRKLIFKVLKRSYGKRWQERGVSKGVRLRIGERVKNKPKDGWWDKEGGRLNYLDFTDYKEIINMRGNWSQIFSKVFREQTIISGKLTELEEIRNSIAHFRPLTVLEKQRLEMYCRDILGYIK